MTGCVGGTDSDFNGDGIADIASADPEATVEGKDKAGHIRLVYGGGAGTVETLHEGNSQVSGAVGVGDQFGYSVSAYDANNDPYRPAGAATDQADSLVVVGAPGEDITVEESNTVVADAGLVQRFHVTADVTATEPPALTQAPEDGAYLGEEVAVVNTESASDGTNDTMFLAVGAPGADAGDVLDAGRVLVIPALADPIGTPTTIQRDAASLPGSAVTQELIGVSLGATAQQLYVGTPYRDPAVYGFAWSSLADGVTSPSTTWQPGQGGIPSDGTAFGAAIG